MPDQTDIAAALQPLRHWLFEDACPLWCIKGIDRVNGGAFDRLSFTLQPTGSVKRTRVQARQIYALLEAGRLAGTNRWRVEADIVYEFLTSACRRPDGSYCYYISLDGRHQDDSRNNYDQAFVLFALAHYYKATGKREAVGYANDLLDYLTHRRKHPAYGFHENDRGTDGMLANPHMHYLEAMLVWSTVSDEPVWLEMAEELVRLAAHKLIDPVSGGIREYFDESWEPVAGKRGRILEPGHQFEWATLLDLYCKARPDAAPTLAGAIDRLYALATDHGVGPNGIHIHSEIDTSFSVVKSDARCWPYTERLRAALMMATRHPENRSLYEAHALQAVAGLWRYLSAPMPGLWHDWIAFDGTVTQEDAPASSLYHIVGAITALDHAVRGKVG
ncbi:AGE family epimerase/isomerase [Kordiimonas gwangyangensis]|uniref:AGE family epimerase/isomerase n=1 Tax=Kordiimonas gwangyangensis TaxID=288022 RepID=UPI0003A44838|nr:AGE family epimerase/isomerase [Kordiimonas gwangyangensis]